MQQEEFVNELLYLCNINKIEYAKITIEKREELKFDLEEGQETNVVIAKISGVSLIIGLCGKMGYAYTEDYDSPEVLFKKTLDNLIAINNIEYGDDNSKITYRQKQRKVPIIDCSFKKKVSLAKELNDEVKKASNGKAEIISTSYSAKRKVIHIIDTNGVDVQHTYNTGFISVHVSYEIEGRNYSALSYISTNQPVNMKNCAENAIAKIYNSKNAISPEAGHYNILINNDVMAKIFQRIAPIFMLDKIDLGLSLIKGVDDKIQLSPKLTIIDDPLNDINRLEYDEEGTKTRAKYIIKNGELQTLLNNNILAKKFKTNPTGNAFGNGLAMGVSGVNMYIDVGNDSYFDLQKKYGEKIIIYEISGLKSGIDISSGKFSLPAKGILEKGERKTNLSHFTISGNIMTLFNSIISVGDDLFWGIPNKANYGSPSILFSDIMITGAAQVS